MTEKKMIAVTAVFYIYAENDDTAKNVVDNLIIEDYLRLKDNESWSIVDTCEVK